MSTLEESFAAVLVAQCARSYPSSAPVDTTRPYVTWEHVGGDPMRYMDGTASAQRIALLQVAVWDTTKLQALALAKAIEDALCASALFTCKPSDGVQGRYEDEVEPPLYGTVQTFEVLGAR